MFQLILTIVAIALTAALLAASINYIPWWYKSAADTEEVARKGFALVEQGYDLAVRNANGVAPSVTSDADGGFSANFTPVLKLLPATPAGFSWKYGQNTGGTAPWNGLNWFCLDFTNNGGLANEGAWRGIQRLQALYSSQQLVISTTCGATVSTSLPSEYPSRLAVTLYVAYVPGITR